MLEVQFSQFASKILHIMGHACQASLPELENPIIFLTIAGPDYLLGECVILPMLKKYGKQQHWTLREEIRLCAKVIKADLPIDWLGRISIGLKSHGLDQICRF